MKLEELLEMRITGKTTLSEIRRKFKGRSATAKKKRGGKAKLLSKGRSGFGQPPRQREIRGSR